jgi:hypothetical protein
MLLNLAHVCERGTTLLVKGLQALAIHAAGYADVTQHCVEQALLLYAFEVSAIPQLDLCDRRTARVW